MVQNGYSPAGAGSRCFRVMAVRARLLWVRDLVGRGVRTHVSISAAALRGRAKAKILVHHREAFSGVPAQEMVLSVIDLLLQSEPQYISVDRGHHHGNDDTSEICCWFEERPTRDARGWSVGPLWQPPGDDQHHDHQGRRRGRSPPTAQQGDPWQAPAADPWSSSSAADVHATASRRSPPRKAPRQRERSNDTSLWANWLPSACTSAADTGNPVYHDTPWARPPRSSKRARLRPTGTPPLEIAADVDGVTFVATGAVSAHALEVELAAAAVPRSGLPLSSVPARPSWADEDDDDLAPPAHGSQPAEAAARSTWKQTLTDRLQVACELCEANTARLGEDDFSRARTSCLGGLVVRSKTCESKLEYDDLLRIINNIIDEELGFQQLET